MAAVRRMAAGFAHRTPCLGLGALEAWLGFQVGRQVKLVVDRTFGELSGWQIV